MKKVLALIICVTLSFGMIGSVFANEVPQVESRGTIYWVDDGSMDGNTIVDQVSAGGLTAALTSGLGAPYSLASKMGSAMTTYITGQTILDDDAYIYYTTHQRRGVEYNGLGEGYDKYYLELTTYVYPNSDRNDNECLWDTTKTIESSFPMLY